MSDNVTRYIDRMIENDKHPSPLIMQLLAYENKHALFISNKYKTEILVYEHAVDLLINLLYEINFIPKENYPKYRSLQILLFKNNLTPLFSAFERITKGFYSDGYALLRCCYESIIRILFISYYPNDYEAVLLPPKKRRGKKIFNLTNFVRDDLKVVWGDKLYSLMCNFAHANNYQVIIDAIDVQAKKNEQDLVAFKLKFDGELFLSSVNIGFLIIWFYLVIYIEIFLKPNGKFINQVILKNLRDTEKAYREIIRTKTPFFGNIHDDFIVILKAIQQKEKFV